MAVFYVSIHHRRSKADQVMSICRSQYIPWLGDMVYRIGQSYIRIHNIYCDNKVNIDMFISPMTYDICTLSSIRCY